MKRILFILMLLSLAYQGWTQEANSHQYSQVPNNARFEIVQSEVGVRFTFKIDKYTGEVFQLVKTTSDDLAWESLGLGPMTNLLTSLVLESLEEEEEDPKLSYEPTFDKVNFQLFMSKLGIRHIYLLHIDTGITWRLTKDIETEILFWSIIE